jgi:hypothetical protein
MPHPASVSDVDLVTWQRDGRDYAVPAVTHAAWQPPGNRYGIVLANWTTQACSATVSSPRLTGSATVHVVGRRTVSYPAAFEEGGIAVTLPPLSCLLVVDRDPSN